jgi:hypothetical protein
MIAPVTFKRTSMCASERAPMAAAYSQRRFLG